MKIEWKATTSACFYLRGIISNDVTPPGGEFKYEGVNLHCNNRMTYQ